MSVGPNVNAPASEAKDQHDRTDTATPLSVTIVPANEAAWEDLQVVLGTRGHRSDCWCQRFRMRGTEQCTRFRPYSMRTTSSEPGGMNAGQLRCLRAASRLPSFWPAGRGDGYRQGCSRLAS
jgi:hypothetical protein